MGVRQRPLTPGATIGPPALTLYAVDPMGEATMSPSPLNAGPGWPSMERAREIMRKGGPAVTMNSFAATAE